MDVRRLRSLAVGGLIIAGLMLLNTTAAHAGCGGPNDPNPCPPPSGDKEKKFKTPVPPTKTVPAPSPTLIQPLLFPSNTPDPAMIMPPAPVAGTGAEVQPPNAPPNRFPWDPGGGGLSGILIGLLIGILIGLLLPMASRSFFDRGPGGVGTLGKGTPGGGDTNPAGSFFDDTVGKGTPGGGDTNPAGSFFDSNPGLRAREAALGAREAALNVREAALKAREAALGAHGNPTTGTDPGVKT
jgi:hypothetical protein